MMRCQSANGISSESVTQRLSPMLNASTATCVFSSRVVPPVKSIT